MPKFSHTLLSDGFELLDFSGKIYRYDLSTGKEELVYDFNKAGYISLLCNDEKIAYAMEGGEVGVIDLYTKTKRVWDKAGVPSSVHFNPQQATDNPEVPTKVLNIGPNTAVFIVRDIMNIQNPQDYTFRLDLTTLKLVQ